MPHVLGLSGKPMTLRSEQLMRHALRTNAVDIVSVKSVAANIYRYEMAGDSSVIDQANHLLSISLDSLEIKKDVLGAQATYGPNAKLGVNGLIVHALIAEIVTHSNHTWGDLDTIGGVVNEVTPLVDHHAHNILTLLHRTMRSAIELRTYAERIRPNVKATEIAMALFEKSGYSLAEANDELARDLTSMRRYGVKPAYFQDGLLHASHEAWGILPPPEEMRGGVTAVTFLANRASLTDLEYHTGNLVAGNKSFEVKVENLLAMVIDPQGNLSQGYSYLGMSTEEILRGIGLGDTYQLIRTIQLMRLYDLVVPIETIVRVPEWPQLETGSKLTRMIKKAKSLTPTLIIPRLKMLENMSGLMEQLEREVEQAQTSTDARTRAELRRHGVVGHIRILPPGRKATPTAVQRAKEELGIVLADNETYVKPHKRGNGDEIRSHRARKR
jgi:hypothetical protein